MGGAFTAFDMTGDGDAQKKSTTYGEEDAFMGSVRNLRLTLTLTLP